MLRAMNNAMEKRNDNNLKNEMAIEILVNFFFCKKIFFQQEIQKLTIKLKVDKIGPLSSISQPPRQNPISRPPGGGEGDENVLD